MRITVKLPQLGETAERGLVVEWLRSEGDQVAEGDLLMIVEVDKVDVDVRSPVAGNLLEVLVAEDDQVAVGAPICVIDSST